MTSIKIPAGYLIDINNTILKFIGRGKRSRRANTILMRKTKLEERCYATSRRTIKLQ